MKISIIGAGLFLFTFSTWAGAFLETFDDGDLADWQEFNARDAVPGSWEILDGELEGTNPGGGARFLTTGDETWQDYSIEVNVNPLEKLGPGHIAIAARVEGGQAISCRISDLFLNDPVSKVLCMVRDFDKNIAEVLYVEPHPLLRMNKWSRLKLNVNGDHFILWINGKKIVETGDPFNFVLEDQEVELKAQDLSFHSTGAGGAGFGLANYTARFDNITIIGDGIPDKGGLSVLPRAKLTTTWANLKRF